jgi:hypothetical protein
MVTEATALPPQDGVGGHDDQSLPPAGTDSGQPNPEEAIAPSELRPFRRPLIYGQLLAYCEVLESELAVATTEKREESKQA